MRQSNPSLWLALTLLVLLAPLTACAPQQLQPQPAVIAPPAVPPLPMQARQPPAPAWCSPTCSAALQIELQSWQRSLTSAAPPERPASGPMTR